MLHTNLHTIPDTLDFLADLGVPTVGLNALDLLGAWPDGWDGPARERAAAHSGYGSAQDRRTRPEADLVHAHAVLPVRSHGQSPGCERLHGRAVQHVHRIQWRRAAVPVVLSLAGQHAHRSLGLRSGIMSCPSGCARGANCQPNATAVSWWPNAAAAVRCSLRKVWNFNLPCNEQRWSNR